MAETHILDSNAILRVTDTQTLAPVTTLGRPDHDKTDKLTITGNGSAREITITAGNGDATVANVGLAIAVKGAGLFRIPILATASFPAAAAGNEGCLMGDATTHKLMYSTGSAWVIVGTQS